MSTELATVFEERGKPLKSEPELGSGSGSGSGSGIRVKKWVKLGTESREPEQKSEPPKEMDLSKYDNSPRPYIYMHGDFVYKNEAWKKSEAEIEDYKKRRRGLSTQPYDAIAPPPRRSNPMLALGGVIRPLPINDKNRPTLIALSQLALTDYNQRIQAPTFVFHRLVKCCFARSQLSGYYITFEAKAKEEEEDPSNSPAITTFQAQVWESENAPHEVIECKIKI